MDINQLEEAYVFNEVAKAAEELEAAADNTSNDGETPSSVEDGSAIARPNTGSDIFENIRKSTTPEQLEAFIKNATEMVSRPVLGLLCKMLDDLGTESAKKLSKVIAKQMHAHTGVIRCTLPDVEYTFCVSFITGERDIQPALQVPENYLRDAIQQIELMKSFAIVYFYHWTMHNTALYNEVKEHLGEIMLNLCDQHPHTLYFKSDYKDRLIVWPFYRDAKGNVLYT